MDVTQLNRMLKRPLFWKNGGQALSEVEFQFQQDTLKTMNLCDATIGTGLTVEHVGGERSFRRRLMELGLVPGTRLELLGAAPFGGPLELLARGCSLSIRREEAAYVAVAVVAPAEQAEATVGQALSAAIVTTSVGDS